MNDRKKKRGKRNQKSEQQKKKGKGKFLISKVFFGARQPKVLRTDENQCITNTDEAKLKDKHLQES